MNQKPELTPDETAWLELTQRVHAESLVMLQEVINNYKEQTGKTITNAMQFAAMDGFMYTVGHVLSAMTMDTLTRDNGLSEKEVMEGSVGALFMFQRTLQNVLSQKLLQENKDIDNIEGMLENFEEKYTEERIKKGFKI